MARITKMPIKWHEECLKNMEAYVTHLANVRDRACSDYERAVRDWDFRRKQIKAAKERGLTDFDPDRFLKAKAPKA